MTDTATAPAGTGDAGATAPAATPSPTPAPAAPAAATVGAGGAGAAPAAPAASPSPTLADGGVSSTPPPAAPDKPTQSWRDRIAGEDKDFLKTLDRFASEADFGKAYRAAQRKISEGQHKKPGPPENATAEQMAEWRKEGGIPESWERYTPKLPDGLVLGTEDKPVVDAFAQYAHKNNWSEEQYNGVLGFYYTMQDAMMSMRQDKDAQFKIDTEKSLREEYGTDFQRNLNALGNFRDKMPEQLSTRLLAGRMADGTVIGNDPAFLRWAIATSLDMDPAATLVPSGVADVGKAVGDEIHQIETLMKTDGAKYWKDEKIQARYRELLGAREKMKARAA